MLPSWVTWLPSRRLMPSDSGVGLGPPANDLAAGLDTNIEEIRSAVAAIPPSAITIEADWVKFMRGLAHEARIYKGQAEEIWEIADSASQAAPGYNQAENRKRWLRYVDEALDRDKPITIATVFDLAKKHGWPGWSPPIAPPGALPAPDRPPPGAPLAPDRPLTYFRALGLVLEHSASPLALWGRPDSRRDHAARGPWRRRQVVPGDRDVGLARRWAGDAGGEDLGQGPDGPLPKLRRQQH